MERSTEPRRGSTPYVNAMLCDGTALIDGEILVRGGARSSFTASGRPLRIAPVGVAAHLTVATTEVGCRYTLQLSLEDQDGTPVALWDGPARPASVRGPLNVADFDIDVPARAADGVGAGTLQVPWCTTLTAPTFGRYQLVISVDDVDARRLRFDVIAPAHRQ